MLDFLKSIVNFFVMLVTLVGMLIKSLIQMITMIPSWLNFLTTSVAYLPGVILPFVMLGITVSVLLLLLGRNNS